MQYVNLALRPAAGIEQQQANFIMKKLLNIMLILNFFTEAPAGVLLVFSPASVLPAGQIEGAIWARNYGVAALAMASMVLWLWPHRDNYATTGVVLGFLMGFHTALTAALLTAESLLAAAALHSILAALCIVLYFQRAKWCTSNLPGADQ